MGQSKQTSENRIKQHKDAIKLKNNKLLLPDILSPQNIEAK